MSRFPAARPLGRTLLAVLTSCLLALPLLAAPPASARGDNLGWSSFDELTWNSHWAAGADRGVTWSSGTLAIDHTVARMTYAGTTYSYAFWTSTWVDPGRSFTQLVPSWTGRTPYGTWLQVFVRARTTDGKVSRWKDMGRWSTSDNGFRRSSAGSQDDGVARVSTDTLKAVGSAFDRYQFRVRLVRQNGIDGKQHVRTTPRLRSIQAVVSDLPARYPATSAPIKPELVMLRVPRYSQMTHQGQNPEFGGGGEAWCSPTSLAMVLGWYGKLPPASQYSWVPRRYDDRVVNHLARMTYDYRYRGTGNWPFNTGYASSRIADAFVTRLPDLRAAERFVRAGIPVVASIAFGRGELDRAPISATNGHLLVIVGFTRNGNPIVNDPAARTNSEVRITYKRGQFERAWLNGSGGLAYIVRDGAHPLPWQPRGMHAW